jgi:hypothetical protein
MSKDLVAKLDDKLRAKRGSFDKLPVIDIAPVPPGMRLEALQHYRALRMRRD